MAINYNLEGKVRNQHLSPELAQVLVPLAESLGLEIEVFSGGQGSAEEGGPRVGSTRHDHGNAADVFLTKDGKRLDWSNPEHLPLFKQFVSRGRAAGLTGIGAGDNYMQPGSLHVGFGTPGVWGSGGAGANAAPWLREAYYGAEANNTYADAGASPAGYGHAGLPTQQPTAQGAGVPRQLPPAFQRVSADNPLQPGMTQVGNIGLNQAGLANAFSALGNYARTL